MSNQMKLPPKSNQDGATTTIVARDTSLGTTQLISLIPQATPKIIAKPTITKVTDFITLSLR